MIPIYNGKIPSYGGEVPNYNWSDTGFNLQQLITDFKNRVIADGGVVETETALNALTEADFDNALAVIVPSAYKEGKIYAIAKDGSADYDITFSRGSSAYRADSNALLQSMSSNIPRLDYEGGINWFFENQATNFFESSQDLTNPVHYRKTFDPIINFGVQSPTGEMNATRINGNVPEEGYIRHEKDLNAGQYKSIWVRSVSGEHQITIGGFSGSNPKYLKTINEDWQRFEWICEDELTNDVNIYIIDTRDGEVIEYDLWGLMGCGSENQSYIPTPIDSIASRSEDVGVFGNITANSIEVTFQDNSIQNYAVSGFEVPKGKTKKIRVL